jgi:hypothetical protein
MRRVGVLANLAENDPDGRSRNAALLEELQQLVWAELVATAPSARLG